MKVFILSLEIEICYLCYLYDSRRTSLGPQTVKSLPAKEHPLEKEMATHSSILAWKIPWMEKAGGLQSVGSQRVRHD